jgi:membrane peptidoglycan carboxypeptidase
VEEIPPRQVRRVMSESTADQVKAMLTAVVQYGTASDIKTDRIPIAGKTGTAEKIDAETGHYVHGLFNSSFLGMTPVDHPEFVCLVLLDEPSQLKYGGQSAAPIFREIVDRMLSNPDYALARRALKPSAAAGDSAMVPDLLGYRYADAVQLLSGTHHGVRSEGAGEVVLAQDPRPGTRMAVSDSVTVSLGSLDNRVMPNLNNDTLRDALLRLKNLSLDVEYNGTGRIIRQEPAAGASVKSGQKCVLTLGWMG